MQDPDLTVPVLTKIGTGVLGSIVSLRFLAGSLFERMLMVVGGATLSYFGTSFTANYLRMQAYEGLVGFLIGLFGMAVATKVYELLGALDTKLIAKGASSRIKKLF